MKMNNKWKNLPQNHLVLHKSYVDWPGIEPKLLFWEVGDKQLKSLKDLEGSASVQQYLKTKSLPHKKHNVSSL
jgi:hypothetical protein